MSHEAAVLIGLGQSGTHIEASLDLEVGVPEGPSIPACGSRRAPFAARNRDKEDKAWDT